MLRIEAEIDEGESGGLFDMAGKPEKYEGEDDFRVV